jgi:hypothetical protein
MLRVNTAKITPGDFAKKWGLTPILRILYFYHTQIYMQDGNIHICNDEDGEVSSMVMVDDEALDVLFDMIQSGDVIKEDRK